MDTTTQRGKPRRHATARQETFGRRLRLLRDDMHMSQVELRDELTRVGVEIGQSYISKLETSDNMPMLEVAAAMARILHTTTDYLALLTDDPEPPQPEPPQYMSPEADELARIIDALPADVRAEALAIARRLARPEAAWAEQKREMLWWLTVIEEEVGVSARQAMERRVMGEFRPYRSN